MSKKIELSGDFASPYVEASAWPVQTAEKERAMKTFDSVLHDDKMEPDIKRAWLMADNPLMYDPGNGGLATVDETTKECIKRGLETADRRIKELTAEKEKVMKEIHVANAALAADSSIQGYYPMTGEQWVTAGQVGSLEKQVAELVAELEVTDKLLNEQSRVMDAIPECPVHGQRCIPHAVDWIDSIRTERAELRRSNAELTAEKEEMLKLLYGRDLEIERLAEALGKCSQAREAALGK